MDSKVLNRVIGDMTAEEFSKKSIEVSDWLKGFATYGKEIIHDEEDFMLAFAHVTMSVIGIVDAVETFQEKMDNVVRGYKDKDSGVGKLINGFEIKIKTDDTKKS